MHTHGAPTDSRHHAGWVRLGGQTLSLTRLRSRPDQHSRLFEQARKTPGYGQCLCSELPLRLVIRLRAGRYHLAGWPGEGARHTSNCAFFKLAPELSGLAAYTQDAIKETADGVLIRLRQPLDLQAGHREAATDADSDRTPTGRNTITLLGLLHYLWEQAGLNRWRRGAGPRPWRAVHAALTHAAEACSVNQRPLTTALHVVAPYNPATAAITAQQLRQFSEGLTQTKQHHPRGLVLGEVRAITPTAGGMRIALAHTRTAVFTTNQLIAQAKKAYRPVFAERRPEHSRQIVLILVERTVRGHLVAVDLSAMLTGRTYIPADSSHEVHMTDRLIARGRDFIKPCRFDATDEVFPDFVLTDVDNPTGLAYLEVWGLTGRLDYERRRRAKEHHYRSTGADLIGWDVATTRLAEVALPPRASRAEAELT